MNCAIHTDTAAAAYCRTCGKALCTTCKHDVRGVVYCEDCIATRLHDTMPAAGAAPAAGFVAAAAPPAAAPVGVPSPGLAAILGFIPGVGAMYNGQFVKGLAHVGVFAALIWAADHVADIIGLFVAFWIFYMVFDAYKTAKARLLGLPLPDPFGFERLWNFNPTSPAPGVPPPAANPAATDASLATIDNEFRNMPRGGEPLGAAPGEYQRAPIGAIILIVLGTLFLLNTLGVFYSWNWFGRYWPVLLIVLGVWTWLRRHPPVEG